MKLQKFRAKAYPKMTTMRGRAHQVAKTHPSLPRRNKMTPQPFWIFTGRLFLLIATLSLIRQGYNNHSM